MRAWGASFRFAGPVGAPGGGGCGCPFRASGTREVFRGQGAAYFGRALPILSRREEAEGRLAARLGVGASKGRKERGGGRAGAACGIKDARGGFLSGSGSADAA